MGLISSSITPVAEKLVLKSRISSSAVSVSVAKVIYAAWLRSSVGGTGLSCALPYMVSAAFAANARIVSIVFVPNPLSLPRGKILISPTIASEGQGVSVEQLSAALWKTSSTAAMRSKSAVAWESLLRLVMGKVKGVN